MDGCGWMWWSHCLKGSILSILANSLSRQRLIKPLRRKHTVWSDRCKVRETVSVHSWLALCAWVWILHLHNWLKQQQVKKAKLRDSKLSFFYILMESVGMLKQDCCICNEIASSPVGCDWEPGETRQWIQEADKHEWLGHLLSSASLLKAWSHSRER